METIKRVCLIAENEFNLKLSDQQIEQLQVYERCLVSWNEKFNLTAITDHDGVWFKHFLDCMSLVPHLTRKDACLIDVGTGAGFPGLLLKIVLPALKITLLDATLKKITFLNHVISELGLIDIKAICGRSEDVAHDSSYREQFDYCTTRAVSSFGICLEICVGLLKKHGELLLIRGPKGVDEMKSSGAKLKCFSLKEVLSSKFTNPYNDMISNVLVLNKVDCTNKNYPRSYARIVNANK